MDTTKLNQTGVEIDIASTPEQKNRIYEFRYRIEKGEDGPGTIKDESDDSAILIFAEANEEIVASFRIIVGSDLTLTEQTKLDYGLNDFSDYEDSDFSFTSKLVLDPRWRNTTLLGKILNAAYQVLRQKKVKFDFTDSSPALVQFYEHLGYRRYKNNFTKENEGYRVPLVMLTEDVEHLHRIKSPFVAIAEKTENSDETRNWFSDKFPAFIGYVTERLIPMKEFWSFLSNRLDEQPNALLKDLSEEEIKKFLSAGIVLHAKQGDTIVRKGDLGNEMFMILKGSAEVCEFKGDTKISLAIFGEGEVFGEMAFLSETARSADVVALSDLEVLVLTQAFMKNFMKLMPETANKVLFNFSLILIERLRTNTQNLVSKYSVE